MIFMIIYIYSYVYLCIYSPSYQHFKAFAVSKFDSEITFLYQLLNKNSKFIVYKPFNMFLQVYMYIYIQYQINILKPLQCPQLQRAQGYVQLAPARKLAWVFVFWLALAQVSWRGGSHDQFISMHGMFECEQYWNQIYTCVSLRSVMHSKYRIMPPPHPPPHFIHALFTKSAPCF